MPMAANGRVEKPEPMKPQFVKLEMPARRRRSDTSRAIEGLIVGGDAYVVPLTGQDKKKLRSRISVVAAAVGKRVNGKFAVRETKLGTEPVIGVWRVK